VSYQVQLEIPQALTNSISSLETIPITGGDDASMPLVGDVATVNEGTIIGEYDRINQQRMLTITADISDVDLGTAGQMVRDAIAAAGQPPRGVTVDVRGQVAPMQQTLAGLQTGLLLAVAAIFIVLGAYFQSLPVALIVLLTIPGVIAGVLVMLTLTGDTLNVQSFMGAIVSLGVAVANAILLTTFAEKYRIEGRGPLDAAVEGARSRLRPILMTTSAMIVGMLPLALGSAQTAPLGRAVIGGLLGGTIATLFVLPATFAAIRSSPKPASPSLDPIDPASRYYSAGAQEAL
jgi:multidrug efflux pump subunit AcrB